MLGCFDERASDMDTFVNRPVFRVVIARIGHVKAVDGCLHRGQHVVKTGRADSLSEVVSVTVARNHPVCIERRIEFWKVADNFFDEFIVAA